MASCYLSLFRKWFHHLISKGEPGGGKVTCVHLYWVRHQKRDRIKHMAQTQQLGSAATCLSIYTLLQKH